jgi:hypothetical protein
MEEITTVRGEVTIDITPAEAVDLISDPANCYKFDEYLKSNTELLRLSDDI